MMVKSRPPEYRRLVDVDGTVQPAYLYHTSCCIVSEDRSGCHDVCLIFKSYKIADFCELSWILYPIVSSFSYIRLYPYWIAEDVPKIVCQEGMLAELVVGKYR